MLSRKLSKDTIVFTGTHNIKKSIRKIMEAKDIAAYGGLILGLVNLAITLFKEFGKKAKLEIIEVEFFLRNVDYMFYDFQINARLRAKNENVYIKEVFLKNDQCFTENVIDDKKRIQLNIPLPYNKIDLKKITSDQFQQICEEALKAVGARMTDYKIEKESNNSITYVDRLTKPRETDGWEEFPRQGWSLEILYNKSKLTKPLNPSIF